MSELLDKHDYTPKPAKWRIWFNGFVCGILLCLLFWGGSLVLNVSLHKELASRATSHKEAHINQKNKNLRHIDYSRNYPAGEDKQVRILYTNNSLLNLRQPIAVPKYSLHLYNNKTIIHNNGQTENDSPRDSLVNTPSLTHQEAAIEPISTINLSNSNVNEEVLNLPYSGCNKQKRDAKSKKNSWDIAWKKFCLELNASDDMYKNFIGPDRVKAYYSPQLFLGSFKNSNHIGQGAGLTAIGPVSKRISVGIGAAYKTYSWSNRIEFGSLNEQKDPIDSTSIYTIDSLLLQKGNWSYFEIPVHIGFTIIKRSKWELGVNTEIAAQLFRKESFNQSLIINGVSTNTEITQKPFANKTIMGSIGIGLEYKYKLSARWFLTAEPYYKWQVSPLGASKHKPGGAGLNIGVTYQFNLHNQKK